MFVYVCVWHLIEKVLKKIVGYTNCPCWKCSKSFDIWSIYIFLRTYKWLKKFAKYSIPILKSLPFHRLEHSRWKDFFPVGDFWDTFSGHVCNMIDFWTVELFLMSFPSNGTTIHAKNDFILVYFFSPTNRTANSQINSEKRFILIHTLNFVNYAICSGFFLFLFFFLFFFGQRRCIKCSFSMMNTLVRVRYESNKPSNLMSYLAK